MKPLASPAEPLRGALASLDEMGGPSLNTRTSASAARALSACALPVASTSALIARWRTKSAACLRDARSKSQGGRLCRITKVNSCPSLSAVLAVAGRMIVTARPSTSGRIPLARAAAASLGALRWTSRRNWSNVCGVEHVGSAFAVATTA
eukprot:scaffold6285_cov121-Isochrysis_galbana.AAC.10